MDFIKIGKMIANERKERGYSQKELADKLSVSDKTVSKWETGKSIPDITMLVSICEIFEISLNELVAGERLPSDLFIKKSEENLESMLKENLRIQTSNKETILGIIILASMIVLMTFSLIGTNFGAFQNMIDLIPLVVEIGFLIALKLLDRKSQNINSVISKCIIPFGAVISLINCVEMLNNSKKADLMHNISACILPLLYGLIIYIIFITTHKKD